MNNLTPKRTFIGLVVALVAVLLLQACGPADEPAADSEQATVTEPTAEPATAAPPASTLVSDAPAQDQGYPAPVLETEAVEAYPGAEENEVIDPTNRPELPEEYPTPEANTGVVSGVVLFDKTGEAPPEAVVYLGDMVTTDTGLRVVRLNREKASVAIPAADGRFLFPKVDPGEYGLILFHPDISFIIDDPNTGHSLIFTVEAGQSVELDEVTISLP